MKTVCKGFSGEKSDNAVEVHARVLVRHTTV